MRRLRARLVGRMAGWIGVVLTAGLAAGLTGLAWAEGGGRVYTAGDYSRAESFMPYSVEPLVFHAVDHAVWLKDGRLWYRDAGPDGVTITLVDPARRSAGAAFDHAAVATALTEAGQRGELKLPGGKPFDALHLPVEELSFLEGDRAVLLTVAGQRVQCELRGEVKCAAAANVLRGTPLTVPYVMSPDGTRAVYLKLGNLWMREVGSGRDVQLMRDGTPDFGYATDNAGWRRSAAPIVVWSPDSKRIATFELDTRTTGRMAQVGTGVGHPRIDLWRYPLAGDAQLPELYRVIVDVGGKEPKLVRLDLPAELHRSTLCDDLSCDYGHGWDDVQWSADSRRLAFVSTSRDHLEEELRIAEAATGNVRTLFRETAKTPLESGVTAVCWRYLSRSNEILWYSQRDEWGQLYLYDATTGKLKRQLTAGEGDITELLRVDEAARTVELVAVGRESGWDPYYRAAYRLHLDGGAMDLLTPEMADHAVSASPDGRYVLDVASTPTTPEVARVLDEHGQVAVELPREDISRLEEAGWRPLTPITVKARDGRTDLYGFMFTPTEMDPAGRYPIVDRVYPGPQTGSCGSRAFAPAHEDMEALAELGFVVVCIDGTGTPMRSRSFHDAHYGDMGDNTIPDQVAGIRQLAARFPWIDASRVGIYGHSGGGAAAAAAMLRFPGFFKVGVSESGNHDNRDYEDDWGEKWQGLLVRSPNGKTNYDSQANELSAGRLAGHLLLIHGTMDDNVPPENTLELARALMDANKDFDMLMVPNAEHAYGTLSNYVTRRRWDYFVRYLVGGRPPKQYRMRPGS